MKAPAFWFRPGWSWMRLLLTPLSWIYGLLHGLDWQWKLLRQKHAALPVICIGNITIGGTGKTPVSQWIASQLKQAGHNPVIVSRGYGGREDGPLLVDPSRHTAQDVGDEPLMLARDFSVIVSRDRPAGSQLAQRLGHDCILLDDGFQNPSLRKTLSLVVVDGVTGLGNGAILPAGPLRETAVAGFGRADAVIVTGGEMKAALPTGLPVFHAALHPDISGLDISGKWLAFCGIGRPDKFFDSLTDIGFDLAGRRAFADHHDYDSADLSALLAEARSNDWRLVTTEKDAVKLPAVLRRDIAVLPLRLDMAKENDLLAMISAVLPERNGIDGPSGA